MSHIPQRKEKDCLNCGTIVQGHYCHNCGQENVVPHETFWHMVKHFLYDITHFDGNFFNSVRYLVFKPGFLSVEYIKGRRASYLHPVKMYVFTSAMFFLLFFSFFASSDNIQSTINDPLSKVDRASYIKKLEAKLKKEPENPALLLKLAVARDSAQVVTEGDMINLVNPDFHAFNISGRTYRDKAEYDSLQRSLPASKRDGWVMRRLMKKELEINERFRENPDAALKKLWNSVLHRLPYMLFVSLPLFALILKGVNIRRKQFYYADHAIFTIHLYVFSFLLLTVVFLINTLQDLTGWGGLDFVILLLFILLFFYLYKAMRKFYGQGRGKTLLKFFVVALMSVVMMLVLFLMFLFFSAFTF